MPCPDLQHQYPTLTVPLEIGEHTWECPTCGFESKIVATQVFPRPSVDLSVTPMTAKDGPGKTPKVYTETDFPVTLIPPGH